MCRFVSVLASTYQWMVVVAFLVLSLGRISYQNQHTCGRLHIVSNATTATCVLAPSSFVQNSSKILIRWYKVPHLTNLFTKDKNVRSLTIHRDSLSHYGEYIVDCFEFVNNVYGDVLPGSTSCIVNATSFKNEEPTETVSTGETTTPSGPGLGNSLVTTVPTPSPLNGTTISIVAICLVITTVVIAGTVLLLKKRRVSKADANARLVIDEEATSGQCAVEDASSIYNEIDLNADDYARIDGCVVFNNSRENLDTVGRSPSLPKRPGNNKSTEPGKTVDVNRGGACGKSAKKEYHNDENKIDDFVVYAKVNKRKTLNTKDEKRKSRKLIGGGDYVVGNRPVSTCMGSMSLLHHDNLVMQPSGPAYSNVGNVSKAPCPQSYKVTEAAAGNELQYTELAHVEPRESDGPLSGISGGADDGATENGAGKCQYATIDFERKAFVAPIRKAPSSWYKRKKKVKSKREK